MFAVVQHQQQALGLENFHECLQQRLARLLARVQHLRHCLRHESRVSKGSQFDQPCTIGIVLQYVCRHLQPKPGFATSAAARKREQARLTQQCLDGSSSLSPAQ